MTVRHYLTDSQYITNCTVGILKHYSFNKDIIKIKTHFIQRELSEPVGLTALLRLQMQPPML